MAMYSMKSTGVAKMPKVKAKPFRDGVKPVKKTAKTMPKKKRMV